MNDAVSVTVIKRTGNLAPEFPRLLLFQSAVGDNVIEHLASIDILEEHIPVVISTDDITHGTNIGVVEQRYDRSFARSPDFL